MTRREFKELKDLLQTDEAVLLVLQDAGMQGKLEEVFTMAEQVFDLRHAIAEYDLEIRGGPRDMQINDGTGEDVPFEVTLWGHNGEGFRGRHGYGEDPFEALANAKKVFKPKG